jgi:hypothetical protein
MQTGWNVKDVAGERRANVEKQNDPESFVAGVWGPAFHPRLDRMAPVRFTVRIGF